jgi:predicted P-loop ATPase
MGGIPVIANTIPTTPIDLTPLIAKYFPNAKAPAARSVVPDAEKSFFQRVNDHAMANLAAWVPALLPFAQEARQGYRVGSRDLGRALQEDLSIQPEGIVDFGVHDQGDEREGKRTPLELVQEHGEDLGSVVDAAMWLCERLELETATLGWRETADTPLDPDEFQALEEPAGGEGGWPAFERNKAGQILASIDNVSKAVGNSAFIRHRVAFDEFKDATMLAHAGTDDWRTLTDADYTALRILMERHGFKPVSKDMARDAVEFVVDKNKFDSAILWLESLEWDGRPRLDRFLPEYFGAEDNDYTRAVSAYMWTAMAGRVMSPGIKADMMPILVGGQGVGKSTGVAALVPSEDFFFEMDFNRKEEDLARQMRGRLVAEVGELKGLHSREIEHIKAYITRTHENWVPKFKEFATQFPRRCLIIGTTNKNEFLGDETGERRFLPVVVSSVNLRAIERDRLQLWAEARERFAVDNVLWQEAERLARNVHHKHKLVDPWKEDISTWLAATPEFGDADTGPAANGERPFTTSELLSGLGIEVRNKNNLQDKRAAAILTGMGYVNRNRRVGGHQKRVWITENGE